MISYDIQALEREIVNWVWLKIFELFLNSGTLLAFAEHTFWVDT